MNYSSRSDGDRERDADRPHRPHRPSKLGDAEGEFEGDRSSWEAL
ncbi:hypothetical protein [Halomontanus rarus]